VLNGIVKFETIVVFLTLGFICDKDEDAIFADTAIHIFTHKHTQ